MFRDETVSYEDCYWLSRDYYDDACSFYRRESTPGESAFNNKDENINNKNQTTASRNAYLNYNPASRSTPVLDAKEFHSSRPDRVKASTAYDYD